MLLKRIAALGCFFLNFVASFAQSGFFEKPSPFDRKDIIVNGRVRAVAVESLGTNLGKTAAALIRKGAYPDLQLELQLWKLAKTVAPKLKYTLTLPTDIHMLDLASYEGTVGLVLVRDREWEWWSPVQGNWDNLQKTTYKLSAPFHYGDPGEATLFESQLNGKSPHLWIPSENGVAVYEFAKLEKPKLKYEIEIPIRGYYKSSIGLLPFEFPFWSRVAIWYPMLYENMKIQSGPALMVPWMDELAVYPDNQIAKKQTIHFKRLTDDEREDAQAYVMSIPTDINGDQITDLIINKFKGAATQMTAETTLHYGLASGGFNTKGVPFKSSGNRAAGAFPLDLNKDGRTDLISASSQFNVWSIIQALTRKQVDVAFNIYFGKEGGLNIEKPSFTREIAFGFDLSDLALKGFLPNLEGDFNGDGYLDAFYARNEKEVTVVLQNPKSDVLFSDVPSATYEVGVLRQNCLGDLDEDGKTDVVLFDKRAGKNKSFTVLMNSGNIR